MRTKTTHTYVAFEPWMIGRRVAVHVFKVIADNALELMATNGGVLTFYAFDLQNLDFGVRDAATPASIDTELYMYRVEVVE